MEKTPLFSVLIANYNNGKYLQEAVDSVLAQTYTNWEIIIVDDKSTDNSAEVYNQYKDDSRFHIYFNDKNEGCGYTKRRCAELAQGDICGFLDPDDTLTEDALEKHIKVHSSQPKVSVIYSRCYYRDNKGKIIGENRLLQLNNKESYFDYRWYGAMHFASYKNDFYKKTEGISPFIKAGVDQDLYFKIEEVGEIYVLNDFTYNYFQRNPNAITKNDVDLWYWNLEVRRATCKRRCLDESLLREDWKYMFECIKKDASFEKEQQIHSSKAYRLGKFLLKPFSLIRR